MGEAHDLKIRAAILSSQEALILHSTVFAGSKQLLA